VVVDLGNLRRSPHHGRDREAGLGVQRMAGVSVGGAFSFRRGEQVCAWAQLSQDLSQRLTFSPGCFSLSLSIW
jgi:hypothetical protein